MRAGWAPLYGDSTSPAITGNTIGSLLKRMLQSTGQIGSRQASGEPASSSLPNSSEDSGSGRYSTEVLPNNDSSVASSSGRSGDGFDSTPNAPMTSGASAQSDGWDTVIRPAAGWNLVDLGELWRYWDLLWMLALRDIKVRYKQTIIGVAWAVIQPLATMAVFGVLFGLMGAKATVGAVPYVVSAYAALLVWQLFATSLAHSSTSLVTNQNMIKKVYCPRIVFPLAPVLAALVDFAVAMVLLVPLMGWYGVTPSWPVLTLPLFVLLAVLTALAAGLWLAALSAMYRDFMYVVPFLTQFWLFVTPVVYETDGVIPEKWRPLYFLNPMAGVVEGFRWAIFSSTTLPVVGLAISTAAVLLILLSGLVYFRRIENTLADWV